MKGKRGFTLIELLTVVVIIGILVGIVIGVAGNVGKKAATSRAAAEISALELALERFKIDNGDYPAWAGIDTSDDVYDGNPSGYTTALVGGSAGAGQRSLFEQLVGRRSYDATDTTGTQYFEVKESQVGTSESDAYFMDPFGYAYGYFYDPVGDPRSLFNQVVPDIWSTSGETGDPDLAESGANHYIYLRWVTNWGSR